MCGGDVWRRLCLFASCFNPFCFFADWNHLSCMEDCTDGTINPVKPPRGFCCVL